MGPSRFLLLAVALALLVGAAPAAFAKESLCARFDEAPPACARWTRIESGNGAWHPPGGHVFAAEADWPSHRGAPPVDFATHFVVLVVEWAPNCCPTLRILDVLHDDATDGYVVTYDRVDDGRLTVISHPYDMVAVEREGSGTDVRFVRMPDLTRI